MSLLAPKFNEVPSIAVLRSPVWELKLTHTRLSDAIMDLMFLPTSEAIRQSCLNIFTAVLAFPPNELRNQQRKPGKYKTREMKDKKIEFLDKCIETAVIGDKLPKKSGKRLRAFLCHFLKPQLDANKGVICPIIFEIYMLPPPVTKLLFPCSAGCHLGIYKKDAQCRYEFI